MGTLSKGPDVTIANGATVSNAIDTYDSEIVAIITPAALTGIAFTFQASHDNVTYKAVTKLDGTAYTISVTPSKYVVIPPSDLAGVRFLKIVSGSAEGAARSIIVMLRTVA